MKYRLDDKEYEVVIERKSNKNTYIRVKNDLKIYVTTSYFVTDRSIKKLLEQNSEPIRKMVNRVCKNMEKENQFYYLGKIYDIIIMPTVDNIDIDGSFIYVKSIKELDKWINKQMRDLFSERLEYWYNRFEEDIPHPSLKIRKMTSRWGVCNRKNLTVTLNYHLIKYDIDIIDYVVIHELSHLVHFDHSKAFWNTVCKYCPNYKMLRKTLK